MADKYQEQMKKVRRARIELLAKHPFFGDLAFNLPIEWNENLNPPTAATDGERIIFHPAFVDVMPPKELVFVLAHEVMHPALLHILRRGTRCPKRWNVACDVVVNHLLVESGIGSMPSMCVFKPDLYHAGKGKVEKIYELLPDDQEYGEPGSGAAGNGSMDAVIDADPNKKEQIAADYRVKLQQALQTARAAGKVPGGLEALVEQMTTPKVPWQQHLRNFVMTTRGTERTWAKRNRRYAATNLNLPGNYGERMGELAFLIDCSGSTSDWMIGQCGAEISSIQEEMRPEKTHVLYFDTHVKRHEEYEPDDPMTVKAYGRGGTCFRTSFEYMNKHGIMPEACIVATDLGCSDYGPEPPFPVLWCVLEKNNYGWKPPMPPWGQVLEIEKE